MLIKFEQNIIALILFICVCISPKVKASEHSATANLPTRVIYDKNIPVESEGVMEQKDSKNLPPARINRGALRFKVDESIEWYASSPHIVKLLNISTKGLGALTDGELKVDDIVNFRILYNGLDLIVDGKTVRCDNQSKVCGFEFIDMDPVTANCFLYINLVMQNRN